METTIPKLRTQACQEALTLTPMKQLRLKRTSSLSLKLEVIMCPRCENDSTRSMGLPPIENEQ